MCFSPEASFIASAVVTTVGVISYKKATDLPSKRLALIPIFFGLQQFSEGFVWLSLLYEQFAFLKDTSSIGFIIFAWIVWPTYVPYTMRLIETNERRKKMMSIFLYLGMFVSVMLAYTMIFRDLHAEILDCSIIYDFDVSKSVHKYFGILYLIVTVIPTLISKVSKVWILGVSNILAFIGTKVFISDRILSIWCFFAAFTSIVVLWIIIERNKQNDLLRTN